MEQPVPHSLFKVDIPRGFFAGVLEAGFSIFILLIAIRFFEAPNYCKAIIAAGSPIGLILSPLLMSAWGNSQVSEARKCSMLMVACSAFIFFSIFGVTCYLVHSLYSPRTNLPISDTKSHDSCLFRALFKKRKRFQAFDNPST